MSKSETILLALIPILCTAISALLVVLMYFRYDIKLHGGAKQYATWKKNKRKYRGQNENQNAAYLNLNDELQNAAYLNLNEETYYNHDPHTPSLGGVELDYERIGRTIEGILYEARREVFSLWLENLISENVMLGTIFKKAKIFGLEYDSIKGQWKSWEESSAYQSKRVSLTPPSIFTIDDIENLLSHQTVDEAREEILYEWFNDCLHKNISVEPVLEAAKRFSIELNNEIL